MSPRTTRVHKTASAFKLFGVIATICCLMIPSSIAPLLHIRLDLEESAWGVQYIYCIDGCERKTGVKERKFCRSNHVKRRGALGKHIGAPSGLRLHTEPKPCIAYHWRVFYRPYTRILKSSNYNCGIFLYSDGEVELLSTYSNPKGWLNRPSNFLLASVRFSYLKY